MRRHRPHARYPRKSHVSGWRASAVICASILFAACGGGNSSTVRNPGQVADGSLEDVLETARSGHNVPALATVIVQDGVIVELAAVGQRTVGGPERVTDADQWHVGSITKSMTSTLAGILIEQGLLDWDTTIADVLLPEVPDLRAEYQDVRLEQLMAHTGGLVVDVTRAPSLTSGDIGDASILAITDQRLLWSAELLRLPPDAAVGTHLYSNGNYIVLGTIIEKVTGEQWETLMQRELFAPLAMFDTGFGAPGTAGAQDQPWGHANQSGSWLPFGPGDAGADNPVAIGPAGTVHSTLRDFSRYMTLHVAGARGNDGLLTAQSIAQLHAAQPGSNYGGGWVIESGGWAGSPAVWHNGSNGRWFAEVVVSADRNAAVFVASNADSRAAIDDVVGIMIRRFEALQTR